MRAATGEFVKAGRSRGRRGHAWVYYTHSTTSRWSQEAIQLSHGPLQPSTAMSVLGSNAGAGKLSHCRTKVRQRPQHVRQEVLRKWEFSIHFGDTQNNLVINKLLARLK